MPYIDRIDLHQVHPSFPLQLPLSPSQHISFTTSCPFFSSPILLFENFLQTDNFFPSNSPPFLPLQFLLIPSTTFSPQLYVLFFIFKLLWVHLVLFVCSWWRIMARLSRSSVLSEWTSVTSSSSTRCRTSRQIVRIRGGIFVGHDRAFAHMNSPWLWLYP